MLPIRHKSIFKNRWIALLWAGGIVWSACEFVGGQPGGTASGNTSDPTSDAASVADLQAAANALGVH
jgi:hypothetical protein